MDELRRLFRELEKRIQSKQSMLQLVKTSVLDPAQRVYQDTIRQTPFDPDSDRIPGTFADLTGSLFASVFSADIGNGTLEMGSSLPYAQKIDAVLQRKGPLTDGERQGLITLSVEDLMLSEELIADWIVRDPL